MKEKMLSVSVVIPTYNRSTLLLRAINSVLPQLHEGDELLVMDDGSTDNTEEALRPLLNRIRYIRLQNGGPSRARNTAIALARGDLIAFLDDDDEWIPQKLALHRAVMAADPNILFSFTNFYSLFKDGTQKAHCLFNWGQREQRLDVIFPRRRYFSEIAPPPEGLGDFEIYTGNIYHYQLLDDYVLPSTLVVRRQTAGSSLYFPENLRFCESWACSSRLSQAGLACFMNVDTTCQHDHGGPRLTDVDVMAQTASRIEVLKNQWGKDDTFLEKHQEPYLARLDEEYLLRIRELIARGESRQARAEMQSLSAPAPAQYRLLAGLPNLLLRKLMSLRAHLR